MSTIEEKVKILAVEMERFIASELFAIEQEDWDFFETLLKKKERHLAELGRLSADVELKEVVGAALSEKICQGEKIACELLAKKMAALKEETEKMSEVRVRIKRVQALSKMQGGTSYAERMGGFNAQA